MNDMSAVIIPKSDQINADDLISGPRTITIERVAVNPGSEQPVSINIQGDRKVFRPCKGMCRVMVSAWGADSSKYAGKSLTLYRDDKVKWGGLEVGGIRISAMSHIDGTLKLAIAESKTNRRVMKIEPLQVSAATDDADSRAAGKLWTTRAIRAIGKAVDRASLADVQNIMGEELAELRSAYSDFAEQVDKTLADRLASFDNATNDTPGIDS